MKRVFVVDCLTHYLGNILSGFSMKAFFATIASIFLYIFGDINDAVIGLIVLMFVDTILGFSVAVKRKKVSSCRMKFGVFKFLLYFMLILSANCFDKVIVGSHYFSTVIHFSVRAFVLAYLSITEFISVLENLNSLGLELPPFIAKFFKSVEHGER